MTIDAPGVYPDLSAEAYHADPCPVPSLSCSIAELLLAGCERKAWQAHPRLNPAYQEDASEKFDLGKAAHALTLGDEQQFEIIEAADFRTKEAKAQRDKARAEGRIPLLTGQWERTLAMVKAGKPQFERLEDGHPFTAGRPEVTLVWQEEDIWCRIRLDWLRDDRAFFPDFKWTEATAHPDPLVRHIYNLGYDFRAAFYRRGIRKVLGIERPRVRFYFQEQKEPYLVSPWMEPSPPAIALGDRKVELAISKWRQAMKSGEWPGYPTHGCYFDPPGWHETQFLEREERDRWIADHNRQRGSDEARRRAADFQKPLSMGAGE